jgi:hypothetical protein
MVEGGNVARATLEATIVRQAETIARLEETITRHETAMAELASEHEVTKALLEEMRLARMKAADSLHKALSGSETPDRPFRASGESDRRSSRRYSFTDVLAESVKQLLEQETTVAELRQQSAFSKQQAETNIFVMMCISYADFISDIVLAFGLVLLGTAGEGARSFGSASFGIIGFSLFIQCCVVRFMGKQPWCSKDVLMTAACLGPALQAYRQVYGEPPVYPGAYGSRLLLGTLKSIEVALESLPELVLQLALLVTHEDGWSSLLLQLSLVISIMAAAVLMVPPWSDPSVLSLH